MNNGFRVHEKKRDYGGDFPAVRSVIRELIDQHPDADGDTLMEAAETECRRQGIDITDSVLVRVLEIERMRRKLFRGPRLDNVS